MKRRQPSWLPWALLLVALVVVVGVSGRRDDGPSDNAERVEALTKDIRCPVCRSQSVYDSDATAARAIRDEVARRVSAGDTDGEILDYVASRYGQEVLLTPPSNGLSALVWILPVVVLVAGAGGLVLAFRRWQVPSSVVATEADRRLVAAALRADADRDAGRDTGRDAQGDPDSDTDTDVGEGSGR